jgi:hypothetical protein
MNVTVLEGGEFRENYWVVSVGLGSPMTKFLLEKAKSEGRCPMGMGDLVTEMIDCCEQWCAENCSGGFRIDPVYRIEIWFENPADAMLFKLTHG